MNETTDRRQQIRVVPLIDGSWAHEAYCSACELLTGGVAPDYHTVLQQVDQHFNEAAIAIPPSAKTRSKISRRWGATTPRTSEIPDYQTAVPAHDNDPYTVATDASVTRDGWLRWAIVTGAGWVRVGTSIPDGNEGSTQAELIAVIEALRFYPRGSTIQVLCDSKAAVAVLRDFLGRGRAKPNGHTRRQRAQGLIRGLAYRPWVGAHTRNRLGAVAGDLIVHSRWVPRDTRPLQRVADQFASQRRGLPGIVFEAQDALGQPLSRPGQQPPRSRVG